VHALIARNKRAVRDDAAPELAKSGGKTDKISLKGRR
jgi:hypothetical protein